MHARVVLGSGTWDGERCPVLRGVLSSGASS